MALNEENARKRRMAEGANPRKRKSLGDGEGAERKKKKKEKESLRSETPEEGEVVEEDSKASEEGEETPASDKSTPDQAGDLPECEVCVNRSNPLPSIIFRLLRLRWSPQRTSISAQHRGRHLLPSYRELLCFCVGTRNPISSPTRSRHRV